MAFYYYRKESENTDLPDTFPKENCNSLMVPGYEDDYILLSSPSPSPSPSLASHQPSKKCVCCISVLHSSAFTLG